MPRIRSIKPEFWKSEKLAKRLPSQDGRMARLLFIGIWGVAEDKTGVARGSPAYLKAEVFPYDDDITAADVARWLGLLQVGRFIIRFEREDQAYLWVRGFKEHQRIDHPAQPSLPEPTPEEISAALEGSYGNVAKPQDSRGIHEDSRGIHEASEHSPQGAGSEEQGAGSGEVEGSGEDFAAGAARPATPESLQQLWNDTADPSLPKWREMPKERREAARKALKARPLRDGPGSWLAVFQAVSVIPFCLGMNERGWKANPDWALKAKSAAKVLEGAYENGPGPPRNLLKGITRAEDFDHSSQEAGPDGIIHLQI